MIRKPKVDQQQPQKKQKKVSESILRFQNDIKNFQQRNEKNKELANVSLEFPLENSINPVHIIIKPQTGFYKGSRLTFVYTIPEEYPYKAPILQCKQRVFHPNIDPKGTAVCLSILKDGWQANNELIEVIYGLWQIIECLNHGDLEKPLDARAAELMKTNPAKFQEILQKTLKGQSFEGRLFDNVWIH